MDRCPASSWTSRRLHPLRWIFRAAAVMKVRRPEWDEQPLKPSFLNRAANQLTTLVGRKQPPRAERMTGPEGWLIRNKSRSARRRSGCMGMRRPPRLPKEFPICPASKPRSSRPPSCDSCCEERQGQFPARDRVMILLSVILAIAWWIARMSATLPRASRTIDHSSRAGLAGAQSRFLRSP
jgi:hypothetical protein